MQTEETWVNAFGKFVGDKKKKRTKCDCDITIQNSILVRYELTQTLWNKTKN